jgi:hypothetical protein
MGRTCGTYGVRGEVHREFCWENLRKRKLRRPRGRRKNNIQMV